VATRSAATVLIVEDDSLARAAEAFALHQAGYRVLTAGTLAETHLWLAAERPDVALVDIGLPDGTGWTLADELKAAGIAVVFVTSRTNVRDRAKGAALGAEDYLMKPLSLADLVASVDVVVHRRAARPEPPAA
jgi:DNA-binding response OmpR family regulator